MRVGLMVTALAAAWTLATAAQGTTQTQTVPVGTMLEMLLRTPLDSATAKIEQRFDGGTIQDVTVQGQVVVPAASVVRGFVGSVKPSGTPGNRGQLTLAFDELRIGEQAVRLRASVVAVLDPKGVDFATRTGVAPVVGANVQRGPAAFAAVMVGAGGTILSVNGADVSLPVGVIVRIRLERPLEILK